MIDEISVLRFPDVDRRDQTLRVGDFSQFRLGTRWGVTSNAQSTLLTSQQSLTEIWDQTGEWWATFKNSAGDLLVLTDPFGILKRPGSDGDSRYLIPTS